ncbi:MAG: dipeptidase [Gemmatimonadetes bacterium]|nr:dipeptidase [Gemmatimonadota bacterium]
MTTRRRFLAAAFAVPLINRGRFTLFRGSGTEYTARCLSVMERALVIDMLSPLTLNFPLMGKWNAKPELFAQADFERFRSSGINVFHTAVGTGGANAYDSTYQFIANWNGFLAGNDRYFTRIDSAADFASVKASGKLGVMLGVQNSEHFRRPADVDTFYAMGQRVSQLTYNTRNLIGNGSTERRDEGLSDFGLSIVDRMNTVGMAVDVSHCGDQTSLDAFEVSKKPVLVTHSNARALNPGHPRCKPDSVIKAVGKAESVMGITGVRNFVKGSEPTTIEDLLNHFDYVAKMIGVEHVGIGSDIDLDGYDDMPPEDYKRLKAGYKSDYAFRDKIDIDEVAHPKRMYDLTDGLIRRKYTDDQILGILGGNFRRVLSGIWV